MREVVWSAGETLAADAVARAVRHAPEARAAVARDAAPNALKGSLPAKLFLLAFVIVVLLLLFRCGDGGAGGCEDARNTFGDASQEYQSCLNGRRSGTGGSGYRSSGGSFGGFSSGGGHK
jgi:uncharacterized membrane protein YgcG